MINFAQVSRSLSILSFADNAFATIVMEYQPLDANITEIRLLSILPVSSHGTFTELAHCQTKNISFDGPMKN